MTNPAASREWRRARMAERVMRGGHWYAPNAPRHASARIYRDYGCRCIPCRKAHTNTNRARRWRQKQGGGS